MAQQSNTAAYSSPGINARWVFVGLWVLLFALYWPARYGGWVSDTAEWLDKVKHQDFWTYVNTTQSRGGLYQFTQIVTYLFYRLLGARPLPWHLLFLTMQAVNCTLVYMIFRRLFNLSGTRHGVFIALSAAMLFCVCPHNSEVVVWKASYHYLQALLMALCIIYWLQQYLASGSGKYAMLACVVFLFATFSHEFFYLIPVFVASLILYYRLALDVNKVITRKAMIRFLLPMLAMVVVHLVLLRLSAGSVAGTLGDEISQPFSSYARKFPYYVFHVLFLGRYFTQPVRQSVYEFFSRNRGLWPFYGALLVISGYCIFRFRAIAMRFKPVILIGLWFLVCIGIVAPMWFPDSMLVSFDRYTYFMAPFAYLLLSFFVFRLGRVLAIVLVTGYALINVFFTLKVNRYWGQSASLVSSLIYRIPPPKGKIVLILNSPEYLNGTPVIGPFWHYSFGKMRNLYVEEPIDTAVYEVVSYNMLTANDGAHVNVVNDSVVHVTLNQWGTWWWIGMWGAHNYETEDFRLNLVDPGHWYELTLKKSADNYLLLYQVGLNWKQVDMRKKDKDQL